MVQWVCACVSLPWILNYFYMCAERKREGEGEKEIERKLDKHYSSERLMLKIQEKNFICSKEQPKKNISLLE